MCFNVFWFVVCFCTSSFCLVLTFYSFPFFCCDVAPVMFGVLACTTFVFVCMVSAHHRICCYATLCLCSFVSLALLHTLDGVSLFSRYAV